MTKGFTLIEIILAIAISATILGIVLFSFNDYRQRELLKIATLEVVSVLRDARARTLVAEGDSAYSVHFDIGQVVLFPGSVYSPGSNNNEVVVLPEIVGLATTSLGATNVTFSRLSGEANTNGAVRVYLLADPTSSTTVTINTAGIISSP